MVKLSEPKFIKTFFEKFKIPSLLHGMLMILLAQTIKCIVGDQERR